VNRKAPILAVLAAVMASLVPAAGASAAAPGAGELRAAAFRPLTERTARSLALRLARGVARERKVAVWHLSDPVKLRRDRAVFLYDDRSRTNVFCTAKIVIEQGSRVRRAFFAAGRCATVPGEALAMERVTLALVRAVRAKGPAVRRSLREYERQLADCQDLVVPRRRQADVERLLDAGATRAFVGPIFVQLDGFATALQDVQPEDPDLVRGVVGWRRLLTLVNALPRAAGDACSAVRQWAANAWAPEAAPADLDELRRQSESLERQDRAIERTAARLARLGVLPQAALGFTPDGLFDLVVPPPARE
jgi:hypothetical protein